MTLSIHYTEAYSPHTHTLSPLPFDTLHCTSNSNKAHSSRGNSRVSEQDACGHAKRTEWNPASYLPSTYPHVNGSQLMHWTDKDICRRTLHVGMVQYAEAVKCTNSMNPRAKTQSCTTEDFHHTMCENSRARPNSRMMPCTGTKCTHTTCSQIIKGTVTVCHSTNLAL